MQYGMSCLLAAAIFTTSFSQAAETSLEKLVAGEVARVSTDHTFTEGPTWHPSGYLLFSDIPEHKIHKLDADGEVSVWWEESGGTNGLLCTADGVLYACQNRSGKVIRIDGGPENSFVIAQEYLGSGLNSPNDLAIDALGGLYFTDPVYGRTDAPQEIQGVYYIAADGVLTRVIEDLPRPNGINITNDGRSLIVANPNERQIIRYAITGPGELGEPTVMYTGDEEQDGNGPDGMALDERGNLYATYKQTVVLSPNGKLIGRIATEKKPANCAFGGADGKTLFITGRSDVYEVPMHVSGQPLRAHGPRGPRIAANQPKMWFVQAETENKTVTLRDLTLTIPPEWQETPSASRMRLATYRVPAAEGDKLPVDFVVFPPMGGSTKANIQRWIGQFAGSNRNAKVTQGTYDGGEYVLADITGTFNMPVGPPIMRKTESVEDARMLAAIVTPTGGGSYYVKLAGPKPTVDAAAEAFRGAIGANASDETEFDLE